MADGSPADPADELTPDEQEVRRLLADARHTGPMPTDVADRLDRVLSGLAQDSPEPRLDSPAAPVAPVVQLAARRRRRAASLLVAAAAVVAVGIGLGQVVGGPGSTPSADRALSGGSAEEQGGDSDAPATARQDPSDGLTFDHLLGQTARVRPRHFPTDVRAARGSLARRETSAQSDKSLTPAAGPGCSLADWGAGTLVPVRYGGERAALVFRAVTGDSQVVDLFRCGRPEVLRSITLPAP